jgi:hypothetical protein
MEQAGGGGAHKYEDAREQWANIVENAHKKPKKPDPKLSGKIAKPGGLIAANGAALASKKKAKPGD